MSIKPEYQCTPSELTDLFEAHLTDKDKYEHHSESSSFTPVQSYHELSHVKAHLYHALEQIIDPDEEVYAFFIGVCLMINHYYLFYRFVMPHDVVGVILLGSLSFAASLIAYVPGAILVGKGLKAIRIALWKRKHKNKPLLDNVHQLEAKVNEMYKKHESLCQKHLTEQVYFEYMLNYDSMVEHIKNNKTYTASFYNHSIYTDAVDLDAMREKMKQAYLKKRASEFFALYAQSEKFEDIIQQAWLKFEAQDSEILEEKYLAFVTRELKNPELKNII
jgi:hypothetical protein